MAFGDIVRTTVVDSDSGDPISATLSGSPAADNLLVYWVMTFASNTTAGTGLLEAYENINSGNGDITALYYRVVQSGDGTTWEVDLGEADQYAAILSEIEGAFAAAPLDQTGESEATNAGAVAVTASGSTTQADEFVAACWGVRDSDADVTGSSSVDNSFVNLLDEHNSEGFNWHLFVTRATKVLTATGTPTVTMTISGGSNNTVWTNCIATFKKAAGGGGPSIPSMGRTIYVMP